jgi:hypothetical protein
LGEHNLETSIVNSDVGKAEVQVQVLVVLDQINDSQEDCLQSIVDHFLTKEASSCNGNWVAVDHAETLLENGILALCRHDLLFSWVVNKMALQA